MDKTEWMITENYWDYKVDNVLFTYDENEIEQNKINKNNAWLLFTPKFIPFYPRLLEMWLTINESLVFWFIDFYLQNSSDKFYFTNEQIWKIFWFWEQAISNIIKRLKDKWFINTKYRLKANGWKIRFIQKLYSDYNVNYSPTITKIIDNNNKINNNNINIYENQNLENQKQEQPQEINNSIPKQDNGITQNLTNGDLTYTIDDIWEAYPSIPKRKWTKQNAEKSLAKKTDEEKRAMMFDMKILKLEYRYKIEDITRWLTCSHWIDNYTIQDEHEIDNRLRKIIAYHMSNTDDKEKMKKRYNDICSIFWEDKVKAFVKEYGRIKNKITLNIN